MNGAPGRDRVRRGDVHGDVLQRRDLHAVEVRVTTDLREQLAHRLRARSRRETDADDCDCNQTGPGIDAGRRLQLNLTVDPPGFHRHSRRNGPRRCSRWTTRREGTRTQPPGPLRLHRSPQLAAWMPRVLLRHSPWAALPTCQFLASTAMWTMGRQFANRAQSRFAARSTRRWIRRGGARGGGVGSAGRRPCAIM